MSIVIHVDFQLKQAQNSPVLFKPKARPEWNFEDIKSSIRARFGDRAPNFVEKAWLKKSKEPYKFGCSHNLKYRTVRPKYWNRPMPFAMDMDPKADVIGRDVMRGGSDPCAWIDSKFRVSFNHILNRRGKALVIHTRSDLIAHDDYLEALDKHNHRVVFYVLDAVDEVLQEWEPGAPSNKRRRIAIDKLISRGIAVQVVHISAAALKKQGRPA